MVSTIGYSQAIYFKLKDTEPPAHISNGQAVFNQGNIVSALGEYQAQPVLKHPDKFHSVYADRLALTYEINTENISNTQINSLVQQLESCTSLEYVETSGADALLISESVESIKYEEEVLMPCPTDDPSDAEWNINRHTFTCVQEAHCITQGDPSIIIAARDNGFVVGHPEHEGQIFYAEPGAYNGECHGTSTSISSAGATNNGFGLSSSGYNCSLALYGWGSDFVADYEDMILRGVRVAHNSYISSCGPSNVRQNIINLVSEQGLIVVGSAGNGNGGGSCGATENDPTYPSAYDQVISVSSISDGLCCETTYNFWGDSFDPPLHHTHNNTVDLLAKGYNVVTGECGGLGQIIGYGTSIAGPHVAGIIGLMLSVNPCLNHDDVLSILQSTGQDVTDVCNNSSYYPNGAPPVPCAESAVIAAQNYIGPDMVIDVDTDWDQKFVPGNIVIKSGATLTIHGVVSLSTNTNIIVEQNADLIIDGGILTSCNEKWGGIRVEGDGTSGNQVMAGRVKLLNNAIIENAGLAISMHPSHLGWPTYENFWGGLLEADDAIFRNCGRVVEFMKYGTGFIEDQSYFNNCTFENISGDAISIWANNNVTFKQCTFNNIQTRGIYAYDSEVIVNDNCVFTNQPTGVDILTTYPIPHSSKIGDLDLPPNEFRCQQQGVFAQSQGNLKPLQITNNKFLGGGLRGVHLNGISHFDISSNDMSDGFVAVQSVSTGGNTHLNQVKNNEINNVRVGGYAFMNNGNLEYLSNCFTNSDISDVYIGNGEIFIEQGNSDIANGNCFTKGGVPEITNTGNPQIKLWVWENESTTSCKFPTEVFNNPTYNVLVGFSLEEYPFEECGAEFSPGVINVQTICEGDFNTKQELLNKISEIEQELDNIYNDASFSENYRSRLIKSYERCLQDLPKNVIIMILEPTLDDPDRIDNTDQRIEVAITYARSLPLFEQKILAYGLMVNTNQLSEARQFVNGLTTENTTNVEKSNFVAAQNINLDYLQDVQNYSLSEENAQLLYTIGSGFEPLDGYARSIYEVITGERIVLDIPEPGAKAETKSVNKQANEPTYSIYPNPSSEDKIFIAIDGKAEVDGMTINMVDIYGKVYLSEQVKNQRHILDITNLPSGTYITSIVKANGEIQHIEKVMVIK